MSINVYKSNTTKWGFSRERPIEGLNVLEKWQEKRMKVFEFRILVSLVAYAQQKPDLISAPAATRTHRCERHSGWKQNTIHTLFVVAFATTRQ